MCLIETKSLDPLLVHLIFSWKKIDMGRSQGRVSDVVPPWYMAIFLANWNQVQCIIQQPTPP